MKKLIIIISITTLIFRIMSSCATNGIHNAGLNVSNDTKIKYDSVGVIFPVKIDSFKLSILSPSSGVQFYRDGIVFLSSSKNEAEMLRNHLSFGAFQAYYASVQDTTLGKHHLFSPSASFSYPCEGLTFSSDFNTLYFTKRSGADSHEKIYHAEFSKVLNGWKIDPDPLDFCTNRSTYSNPTLSADGTIMVFSSDKAGSFGGMDLWFTKKVGVTWKEPENLGDKINTKGNELFPHLDPENNLYFSSNGLPGCGGYDIFLSRYTGTKWENPANLTKPINSENDELAFTVNPNDGKSAFFTTRQKSRTGKIQLYLVSLNVETGIKDSKMLSDVLYSISNPEIGSEKLKLASNKSEPDSIKKAKLIAGEIDASKLKAAKSRTDSIEVSKLKARDINAAKIRAISRTDSIDKARSKSREIDAARTRAAKSRTDSLLAIRIDKERSVSSNQINDNIVTYKVQFLASMKSKGTFEITVNEKKYTTSEYFYLGAFRYTIGEFSTLKPAAELQNTCRKYGQPQAFVVAFKNNVRSNDLKLFK